MKRHDGGFSGKLIGGDGPSIAYQDVPVSPGRSYQLSGYWRNGDRTAAFDVLMIEVRWLSAPGGADMAQAGTEESGNVVSDWTPFMLPPVTAPPGAGAARILLKSKFGVGAFDNVAWTSAGQQPAVVPTLGELLHSGSSAPPVLATPSPNRAASTKTTPAVPPAAVSAGPPPLPRTTSVTSPQTTGADKPIVLPVLDVPVPSAASAVRWVADLRAARKMAAAEGKAILVFFTGDDEVSRRIESGIMSDPAVAAALQSVIPVKMDFRENKNLAAALRVTAPATVTLYDSRGEYLTKIETPTAVQPFLEALKKAHP